VNLAEARNISISSNPTPDELLEAHKIVAVEHGYLLAIVTRRLEDNPNIESELWDLLLVIAIIEAKIKIKFNNK